MNLIYIGAFRETTSRESDPSIVGCLTDVEHPFKARILSYLTHGHLLFAGGGLLDDVVKPTGAGFLFNQSRTDGTYSWSDSLAYYVERYNLILPREFVEHMASNDWQVAQDIDCSVFE